MHANLFSGCHYFILLYIKRKLTGDEILTLKENSLLEGGKTNQQDFTVGIWAIELSCRVKTNNITTMYSYLVLVPIFIQGRHIPTIYHLLLAFHQRTSPCCWLTSFVFHFVSGFSKACTQSILSSCTTFFTSFVMCRCKLSGFGIRK